LVKLNPKYEFFSFSVILLIAGIIINIIAIYFCLLVPRIRNYERLSADRLLQAAHTESENFVSLSKSIAGAYSGASAVNIEKNRIKSKNIDLARNIFFVGVTVILISTILQLSGFFLVYVGN